MMQFTLKLEFNGSVPLYTQLYRYIVDEIRAGRLTENERMPSKRSLCEYLGISQSTVETAYSILVAEGYLRTRPRSGYFVCPYEVLAQTTACPPTLPPVKKAEELSYHFSTSAVDTSIFPYATWAKLSREVIYENPALLQRGDSQGDLSLRRALSGFLHQYRGVRCDPAQIIIGAGMEYLLNLIVGILPADSVFGLETPGYTANYRTLQNNNRTVCPIPLDADGISVKTLAQSSATVAYVTPSHQFPMGITMPIGRRTQLLKWASLAPERYVIEDDYDSEFRYTSRPIPAMQGLDDAGRVVYIGTFSRSIAPSIRVAYLVLPMPLLARYHARFDYAASTVSRFEQQTLARFIAEGFYARHLRRVSTFYRDQLSLLLSLLCEIPGVSVSGHDAGLHFLLTHASLSELDLVTRAATAGVRIHGLSEYCHHPPQPSSTVVLGFAGLSEDEMIQATRRLAEAWH